ncbi:hypothetical protein BST61_g2880 [Cercospora zeina]
MEANNAPERTSVEQAGLESSFDRDATAPEAIPTYLPQADGCHDCDHLELSGDETKDNSSSPLLAIHDGRGVAVVEASSAVFSYYQATNGSILESRRINDSEWQAQSTIVAQGASPGTAIAASSVNITGTPYILPIKVLSNNATQPETPALQVNLYPDYSDDPVTIRLYYGSASAGQGIQELGMGSDEAYAVGSWHGDAKNSFLEESGPNSGVGATSLNYLARLYVRNITTGHLAQWTLRWGEVVTTWLQSKLNSLLEYRRLEKLLSHVDRSGQLH